ncbi:MAG TPA: SDR family oxidoreductase [bacterium]|nr:SDR family oxidoreductase [bacterium]
MIVEKRTPERGTALITGGAKRIGRTIALALAREGFAIALHYRSSHAEADALAGEIRELGVEAATFRCDFSDPNEVSALIDRVFAVFPDCRILVHNASLFERATLPETTPEFFDRLMTVNLKTPIFLSRAFAGRCESGQIITLLDTRIRRQQTSHFVYSLTKKALRDFTQMAAKALAPGIRVNGIAPGLILPSAEGGPEAFRRMGEKIPLGHTGDPEDIARAVLFLVRNDFITGECLYIDGGEHLI